MGEGIEISIALEPIPPHGTRAGPTKKNRFDPPAGQRGFGAGRWLPYKQHTPATLNHYL
jgi:hypothetical protein